MANPYFNATYYLANNPDLFAAGINTVEGAWAHYVQFGAAEALQGAASRSPAPWFDIAYYLKSNSDLATAGLTAGQLFEHFINFGIEEGRQPSADANVNSASLAAYAAANADLREAFGIEEGAELTPAQELALAQHFYAFGYAEPREGKPAEYEPEDPNTGETFTLTAGVDTFEGTAANDTFNAALGTLQTGDTLVGGGGDDVLNATLISTPAQTPVLDGIETLNLTTIAAGGALSLASASGVKSINVTGTGDLALTGFDQTSGAAVQLANYDKVASVTANSFDGTTDAFTVKLDGAGTKAGLTLGALAGTKLETLNIESNGAAANALTLALSGTLTEITKQVITGSADLTLKGAHSVFSGRQADLTEFTGALSLDIDRNGATTAVTNLTGIAASNITVRDSAAGGDNLVLSNIVDGATVTAASTFTATTIGVKGAATKTDNSLTIALDDGKATTSVNIGATTVNAVESLSFVSSNAPAAGNTVGALTADAVKSLSVSGDAKLTISMAAGNTTLETVTIAGAGKHDVKIGNVTKNVTIDASEATGGVTIDASAVQGAATGTKAVSITGGSGADAITLSGVANVRNTVDAGDGNDTITLSLANAVGATSITGGAGTDTIRLDGVLADAANFTAANVNITDFTAGAGGDVLSLKAGVVGGAFDGTVVKGTNADFVADKLFIKTDDGIDAAADLGNLGGPALVMVYNNTSGVAEIWGDADGDFTDGSGYKIASFENITTVGALDGFVDANFAVFA